MSDVVREVKCSGSSKGMLLAAVKLARQDFSVEPSLYKEPTFKFIYVQKTDEKSDKENSPTIVLAPWRTDSDIKNLNLTPLPAPVSIETGVSMAWEWLQSLSEQDETKPRYRGYADSWKDGWELRLGYWNDIYISFKWQEISK